MSCSLQRVFLGVSHPPGPSARMKAAGGTAAVAAGAGRQLASIPPPLLSASLSPYSHHSSAPGAAGARHWVHRAVFQQPQRVRQPRLPQPDKLAPRPKWKSKAAGSEACMKEGEEGESWGFAIWKGSSRTEKFQQNIFPVTACLAVNIATAVRDRPAPDWKVIGIW